MRGIVLTLAFSVLTAHACAQPAALKIHFIGVGEYDAAESVSEFKKYLEGSYRVDCSASPGGNSKSLDNLGLLKNADLLFLFARRLNLPEEQMAIIRAHWENGKPIVALRTASHAFQQADIDLFSKVLGGAYTGPGSYTAPFKAIVAMGQEKHPILQGVGAIDSRGCYNFKLGESAVVLQVVESNRKTPQPVSWVHSYKGARIFYSTMGVKEDFRNEDFRRVLVNAISWTSQRKLEMLKKE